MAKRKPSIPDFEAFNAFCMALPAVTYVVQWSDSSVWKVGGKVFAMGRWDSAAGHESARVSFKVTPMAFELLKEEPGCIPAPYLASRGMTWIQAHQDGLSQTDFLAYVRESHRLVAAGLSKKAQRELGLLPRQEGE